MTARTEGGGTTRYGIVSIVYLIVASSPHYFEHASTLKPLPSDC